MFCVFLIFHYVLFVFLGFSVLFFVCAVLILMGLAADAAGLRFVDSWWKSSFFFGRLSVHRAHGPHRPSPGPQGPPGGPKRRPRGPQETTSGLLEGPYKDLRRATADNLCQSTCTEAAPSDDKCQKVRKSGKTSKIIKNQQGFSVKVEKRWL